jgi:hypothetical protein
VDSEWVVVVVVVPGAPGITGAGAMPGIGAGAVVVSCVVVETVCGGGEPQPESIEMPSSPAPANSPICRGFLRMENSS